MNSERECSEPPSDHDLLIRIDERVKKLDRCVTNHLHRHWELKLAIILAGLTGLVSVVTLVLSFVIRRGGV